MTGRRGSGLVEYLLLLGLVALLCVAAARALGVSIASLMDSNAVDSIR